MVSNWQAKQTGMTGAWGGTLSIQWAFEQGCRIKLQTWPGVWLLGSAASAHGGAAISGDMLRQTMDQRQRSGVDVVAACNLHVADLGGLICMIHDEGIRRMRRTIGFLSSRGLPAGLRGFKEEACCDKGCCTIPDASLWYEWTCCCGQCQHACTYLSRYFRGCIPIVCGLEYEYTQYTGSNHCRLCWL